MVSAEQVLNTQLAAVFITFLLWFCTLGLMRSAQKRAGYDNKNPRSNNDALEGWGARAHAANANTLEALVFITSATAMNIFGARKYGGVATATMAFSIIFIVCRVDAFRTGIWVLSMISVLALFIMSFIH
ncbi:hypothetical protein INT44_003148 [Umbelopsis vinacea]|uniref:MAPEG family protein n=1 Tax=Umbelopsis vinacea TaxID=44442 RepID=A0A8H7UIA7_9FUNG|nr:hypothetical protein INT44_003148 [Umbelopsis vinacea]